MLTFFKEHRPWNLVWDYQVVEEEIDNLCRRYVSCWYWLTRLYLSIVMRTDWLSALVAGSGPTISIAIDSKGPAGGKNSNIF